MAEVEMPSSGVLGATAQAGEGCRAGRSRPVTAPPAGHLEPTANPAQITGLQPPLVVITGPLTCMGESVSQSERSSCSKAHAWARHPRTRTGRKPWTQTCCPCPVDPQDLPRGRNPVGIWWRCQEGLPFRASPQAGFPSGGRGRSQEVLE